MYMCTTKDVIEDYQATEAHVHVVMFVQVHVQLVLKYMYTQSCTHNSHMYIIHCKFTHYTESHTRTIRV